MQSVSREHTQHLLHRIYRHVANQPIDIDVSLLGGQMGYALFETYYHRHFGIEDDSRIWERISASLNEIQEGKLIHSFAGGIIGVAWGFLQPRLAPRRRVGPAKYCRRFG
jgi:hypothetical protein